MVVMVVDVFEEDVASGVVLGMESKVWMLDEKCRLEKV